MQFWWIVVACCVLSFPVTYGILRFLRYKQWVDHPNDRSNHQQSTPIGGGIALNILLLPAWFVTSYLYFGKLEAVFVIPCAMALLLAAISLLDDLYEIRAWMRLLVQLAAVVAGLIGLYGFELQELDHRLFPAWMPIAIELLIVGLGWLWFINLYNFMDGIDGITSVETYSITVAMLIICLIAGYASIYMQLCLVVMASMAGFVMLNWHPAKLFMGDVGSIVLGYLLGFLLLCLALEGSLLAALLIPLYYLVDSSFTLLKRLFQGKKIWQAHSEHAYQQAVRKRKLPHHYVCIALLLVNIFCLMGAVFIEFMSISGFAYTVLVNILIFLLAFLMVIVLFYYWGRQTK